MHVSGSCSCSDCPASCSGPPPTAPPPPQPWVISINGFYLVMIFVFITFLIIFGESSILFMTSSHWNSSCINRGCHLLLWLFSPFKPFSNGRLFYARPESGRRAWNTNQVSSFVGINLFVLICIEIAAYHLWT